MYKPNWGEHNLLNKNKDVTPTTVNTSSEIVPSKEVTLDVATAQSQETPKESETVNLVPQTGENDGDIIYADKELKEEE